MYMISLQSRHFTIVILVFFLLLNGCSKSSSYPSGHFLGLLRFPSITYHILLDFQLLKPKVINTTFKANEFSLDTIFFRNDSLTFRLKDFYSEFRGRFDRDTNTISGQWIGEDSSIYLLNFFSVQPDTVSGLHPRTTSLYQYAQPPSAHDGIMTCNLANQNLNPIALDSILYKIIKGKYSDIHSLLIARNNCLVLEEYFYRFDDQFIYNIQSATKSLVSALTGIALSKGEISSIDEPLCQYLPDYQSLACNPSNKKITLRQLLTMSTGIAWDEQTYDYLDERNSAAIAANKPDQFVHLLSLPHLQSSTPVFAYNSLNHSLMNAVLRNATHLENKVELNERLLKPLGIEKAYMGEPSPMGVIGDIGLRPRDMLKFGLLYLNDGRWNGNQIVAAAWVKESTVQKISPRPGLGYGYFWWTKQFEWKGKPAASFFAWGYGGQYIFVVPDARLVVVMTGSRWSTDPGGQAITIMENILHAVLPIN